ncbi:MAG: alpha/beta fold hydrolase, partial [Chloroflexi bacterium]|nr:alpha/beta fold hydrolase [Chloroflexota bacterium]
MTVPTLLPNAQPIYYPGNRIGCLMVHGLTGIPQEVRWIGHHLHQTGGYTVFGPLLPGHGTQIADLNRMRWQDWYISVLAAFSMLQSHCDQVFVIGESMGAALSLLFAAPQPVAGVVSLAAPHDVNSPLAPLLPLASLVGWNSPKPEARPIDVQRQADVKAEQARRAEALTGHFSYSNWSARGLFELSKMMQLMRSRLPSMTAPALLMHAQDDSVVGFAALAANFALVGSSIKRKIEYETGGHLLGEFE